MDNVKVAKQLIKIAKSLESLNEKYSKKTLTSTKLNDPSDFDNFKKHIMNVCENEIKNFQELYRFLQLNYDALNQSIDIFDETDEIIKKIKKMYNKTRNAKHIVK